MGRKNQKIKESKRETSAKEGEIKTTIPWGKIRLVIILFWFLGIQATGIFLPKSEFEKAKKRIIENPQDLEARLVLAGNLLQNNRLTEAGWELSTALNLQQSSNETREQGNNESTLGQQASKLEELILKKQESDPKDLEILIRKWQQTLAEKPDYRDGWLKMALYLIKVKRVNEAQKALERAKELDPNYKVVREVEKFLP